MRMPPVTEAYTSTTKYSGSKRTSASKPATIRAYAGPARKLMSRREPTITAVEQSAKYDSPRIDRNSPSVHDRPSLGTCG